MDEVPPTFKKKGDRAESGGDDRKLAQYLHTPHSPKKKTRKVMDTYVCAGLNVHAAFCMYHGSSSSQKK